jgi:hypothetical protein
MIQSWFVLRITPAPYTSWQSPVFQLAPFRTTSRNVPSYSSFPISPLQVRNLFYSARRFSFHLWFLNFKMPVESAVSVLTELRRVLVIWAWPSSRQPLCLTFLVTSSRRVACSQLVPLLDRLGAGLYAGRKTGLKLYFFVLQRWFSFQGARSHERVSHVHPWVAIRGLAQHRIAVSSLLRPNGHASWFLL